MPSSEVASSKRFVSLSSIESVKFSFVSIVASISSNFSVVTSFCLIDSSTNFEKKLLTSSVDSKASTSSIDSEASEIESYISNNSTLSVESSTISFIS